MCMCIRQESGDGREGINGRERGGCEGVLDEGEQEGGTGKTWRV